MYFPPDPIPHAVLAVLCVVCTYTDLRDQTINDWATLPALALGIVLAVVLHGLDGLVSGLLGMAIGFGVFGLFWYMGVMASGDVFMMGAVGALVRFPLVLYAMLYASILGVVVAFVWAATHGQLRQVGRNMVSMFSRRKKTSAEGSEGEESKKTPFPFGVAIAAGSLWAAAVTYWPVLGLGVP